jgi:hypothetical protein
MAVINDPTTASQIQRIGMASGMVWTPAHVASGPLTVGAGGAYRLSMQSGTIAAALAANSELFQFRYVTGASRVCIVHGVSVSAGANVAASAAALQALRLTVARGWTAAGSGGTRATMTGNNQKLRTSFTTSEVNDIGMATTGALTAGTKTLDAQDLGSVTYGVGTGAITTSLPLKLVSSTNLLGEFSGGLAYPLILANQEGFVIRSGVIGPAGMTWQLSVSVIWSEVDGF